MELTSTNRSCGLTAYFFRAFALNGVDVGAIWGSLPRFEARREKVKAITTIASLLEAC